MQKVLGGAPCAAPFSLPGRMKHSAHVETDEGITRLGEAAINGFAKTTETAIHELKRFVVGLDARTGLD